jgi:hypothetical protein
MNETAERLERDTICRAAIGMWLQAGAPAGERMNYLPAAEIPVRSRG